MKRKIISKKNILICAVFIFLTILMTLFIEEVLYHFLWTLVVIFVCIVVIMIIKKKDALKYIGTFIIMFIGSALIGIALSLILPALGINFDFKVKETLLNEEAGMFQGEILNNGWISETEDYIIYIYQNKDEIYNAIGTGILVRRDRDWTNRIELTECLVDSFVVGDSYIYYTDASHGNRLYRMNYDGTDPTLIIDEKIYSFTISEDTIFYSSEDGIYKLDYANYETTKLSSYGENIIVKGNCVYFSSEQNSLSRVKVDGTQEQQLQNDINEYYITDNDLYYTKMTENSDGYGYQLTLYKQDFDTLQVSEITTLDRVITETFDSNYLYYEVYRKDGMVKKGLYRINLDGTGNERINKVPIWQLNAIQGDWMYVLQYSGFSYRIKLDGSVAVVID